MWVSTYAYLSENSLYSRDTSLSVWELIWCLYLDMHGCDMLPPVSNNAQAVTKSVSQFVTLSTYPVTLPRTAIPGNLLWCCSHPWRDRVGRNSCQRVQQSTRAKSKYFDLHLCCITMPQLFTLISGSLCSSVKVGNRLRFGRPRDGCSIPGSSSLLYSNPHTRSDPETT